jgi:hypothetical protein
VTIGWATQRSPLQSTNQFLGPKNCTCILNPNRHHAAAAVAGCDSYPMAASATDGAAGDSEDYSPAATVVRFDPPLSLLRAPVPSSRVPDGEDPVLAFRDAASWQAAWDAAEASLVTQCEVTPLPRRRTRVVKAMNFATFGCNAEGILAWFRNVAMRAASRLV